MNWTLKIADSAQKALRRLPQKDRDRVSAALTSMAGAPLGGDIVRLRGRSGVLRRRVGEYRIFFSLHPEERIVDVTAISRRTSTTY